MMSKVEADTVEAKRLAHEEALANGAGIECGCCFGEEIWVSLHSGLSDVQDIPSMIHG